MRRLALFALLALAACDRADKGTSIAITTDNGSQVAAVDGATGEFKIDAPGFKGAFSLPRMQLDADSFDLNGVKLYPGSSITGMNIIGKEGSDGGIRVTFDSPAAPTAVRDWFLGRLNQAGYTVSASSRGLFGETEDDKPFRIDLTPAGTDRSTGVISIGA